MIVAVNWSCSRVLPKHEWVSEFSLIMSAPFVTYCSVTLTYLVLYIVVFFGVALNKGAHGFRY